MKFGAEHHAHKRTRKQADKQLVLMLDRVVLLGAIVMPLAMTPQVIKIYTTQSASDLSLAAFLLLFFFTIPWVMYGFVHKEKPIIVMNIIWLFVHLSIIVGYFLYA